MQKRNPEQPTNSRPICAIPSLYNLFSKLLYNRLYKQLDRHQTPDQAQFRRGYWESGSQSWTFRESYTGLNTKAFGKPHNVKKLESHTSSSYKDYPKNRALKSEPTQKAVSSNYCAAPNKQTHSARYCSNTPMHKTNANGNKNW